MPALVTHHRFATKALSHARPEIIAAAKAAPAAFRWGAQGPDIFFFYSPFRSTNPIMTLGKEMHHTKIFPCFHSLTRNCAGLNRPEATAYLMGMCCHYTLDRMIHPFVTYICNYRLDPLYPQLSPSVLHRMCEAELDRALIAHMLHGESKGFRAYQLLHMDKQATSAASALLGHTAKTVYDTRVSLGIVRTSMRNLLHAYRLLHDPSGRRSKLVGSAERLMTTPGVVSSMMRPTHPLRADCVNASHRAWIDAAMPHMRRYDSFFSLVQQAQRPALQLMDACYTAMQTGGRLPPELFPTNYSGLPE